MKDISWLLQAIHIEELTFGFIATLLNFMTGGTTIFSVSKLSNYHPSIQVSNKNYKIKLSPSSSSLEEMFTLFYTVNINKECCVLGVELFFWEEFDSGVELAAC